MQYSKIENSLYAVPELYILGLLLIFSVVVAFIFWRRSIALEIRLDSQRKDFEERLDKTVKEIQLDERLSAKERLDDYKANSLSVTVHPFVNTEADKGIFTRFTKVEVGYKYQLFVQGFPCFEPHTVVLEKTVHKEVDEKMLDILKQRAQGAAESAVNIPSGGAAKTAITVAKTLIKLVRK
jgi:hypothetical protein